MKFKKLIAGIIAAAMCMSLGMTAFANPEEDSTVEESTVEVSTQENTTEENSEAESTTVEEASSEESSSEEHSNEHTTEEKGVDEDPSEEETTQEPSEGDVIALIIKLLGQIDFDEVKDTLNDINEALGLPRVEDFTDVPAYADAIFDKLEEMGLNYGDIINGLGSGDLLAWLGNLIFGGGSQSPIESTTAEAEEIEDADDFESTPDTGIALGASLAALAALGLGGTTAFVLRKKNEE